MMLGSFIFDMDDTQALLLKGGSNGGIPVALPVVGFGAHHADPCPSPRQSDKLLYGIVPAHVYPSTAEVLPAPQVLDGRIGKLALESILVEMRGIAGVRYASHVSQNFNPVLFESSQKGIYGLYAMPDGENGE